MNLLVVGASYRTAPVSMLERLAVPSVDVPQLLSQLLGREFVREAAALSTCNRVEIYTVVSGFHGGLADVCAVLAEHTGLTPAALAPHLYVHYDAAAVDHAFRVATGLESMVVGEAQILGQLRDAYHAATEADSAGRLLHELMQQALRVGKRAHAETGIDRAGQSVVSAALDVATDHLGDLTGRSALVIGAGAMGSLALATLTRAGVGSLAITNRGAQRATRLVEAYEATHVPFPELPTALADVDIVISATAAIEPVLGVPVMTEALATRDSGRGPLVLLDLAVPRDVASQVGTLPGIVLVDMDALAETLRGGPAADDATAVARIVETELDAFLSWLRGADVAPTVAALRARAEDVVAAELRRLSQRRPELTEHQRADVAHAIHRVVQRLLHSPTVKVRQLAAEPGGDQYAALLRQLFDLDVPSPSQAANLAGPAGLASSLLAPDEALDITTNGGGPQ